MSKIARRYLPKCKRNPDQSQNAENKMQHWAFVIEEDISSTNKYKSLRKRKNFAELYLIDASEYFLGEIKLS